MARLPPQYLFPLMCCLSEGCPHPICQSGQPSTEISWFPGGSSVKWIPSPIPDLNQPWGSQTCMSCTRFCSGYYLSPEDTLKSSDPCMAQPPSHELKEFGSSQPEPTENIIEDIARKTFLPVSEVKIWLDHLKTIERNRKREAAKAAETHKHKAQRDKERVEDADPPLDSPLQYYCGICGGVFLEGTDEVETWIGCERCESWFHSTCVRVDFEEPEDCVCKSCIENILTEEPEDYNCCVEK